MTSRATSPSPLLSGAAVETEGQRWLAWALKKAADGNRNETGKELALQLRDNRLSVEDAQQVMRGYQRAVTDLGDEPYTEYEALATLRSIYGREPREPAHSAVVLPALTDEALTDVGNADRFAAEYGHRLKHVAGWGWVAYDGKHWARGADKLAQELAKACLRGLLQQAACIDDRRQRDAAIDHAKRSLSGSHLDNMLRFASSDPRMSASVDDFDKDRHLLNVANGVIDLRDGTLREHRASDMLAHLAPVMYDPEAKCPRFQRYLADTFPDDPDLVGYIQRLVGYSATGETSEQIYLTLFGSGANGKGTLVRILAHILGEDEHSGYAGTLAADVLTKSKYSGGERTTPGLHTLPGKRFVAAQEPEGEALNTGLIKSLTGEDRIQVNPKHRDAYSIQPVLKLWVASNRRLDVSDASNAIWRRTLPVHFTQSFVGREDKNLDADLRAEASGILNWIVAGAVLWYSDGLGNLPTSVDETRRDYRAEQDPASLFFEEILVATGDSRVKLGVARDAYLRWQETADDAPYVNARQFTALAEAHGCRIIRSNGERWVIGRRLAAVPHSVD